MTDENPPPPSPVPLRPARPAADLDALLARITAGDRAAFAELYKRTSPKLFYVCLRILPMRHEAEEALQESYLTIWQRAESFDPARGSAMTWLITLARNCAIDRSRKRKPGVLVPIDFAESLPDTAPLAIDTAIDREQIERLTACLDELEAKDARLVRTAFFEGSTYAELATRAAMPLGTIKSRVRRALIKLEGCLR